MQSLPVSRVVNVSVFLTPAGARSQNLSTLLLLGNTNVIDTVERYREYDSIDGVALDFGTVAPEYQGALLWFEQQPQPRKLWIGRWAQTPTAGILRGATLSAAQQVLTLFTAISSGAFNYSRNGAAVTTISGLNFSAATNLNGVASVINAALAGNAAVTWNAAYSRFEITSSTTGAGSSISFLTAPPAGQDISTLLGMRSTSSGAYVANGIAAETAVEAVAKFDQDYGQSWYAAVLPGASSGDHLEVSAFLEATNTKHIYGITTQDAAVLNASSTTDLPSQLKALRRQKTVVLYSSSSQFAVCSLLAKALGVDYTANSNVITLMYKQLPGIVAESLNSTQASAVEAKNCNVFVNYNNDTAIVQRGTVSSGSFIDISTGTDWLAVTLQQSLYNLLYTSPTKIPQTDAGVQLLTTTCEAVCSQAVINGLLAPGVWNSAGFGLLAQGDFMPKGYYVYAPRVATQNPADRAARKAPPIQVAAKLAGAVHDVTVAVTVNQ